MLMLRSAIWIILGVGLVGLLAGRLFDIFFFEQSGAFQKTAIGRVWIWSFSGLWLLGMILIPVKVWRERHEVRRIIAAVERGEIDPGALPPELRRQFNKQFRPLPRWVYVPIVGLALALGALLLTLLVGVAIAMWVRHR